MIISSGFPKTREPFSCIAYPILDPEVGRSVVRVNVRPLPTGALQDM